MEFMWVFGKEPFGTETRTRSLVLRTWEDAGHWTQLSREHCAAPGPHSGHGRGNLGRNRKQRQGASPCPPHSSLHSPASAHYERHPEGASWQSRNYGLGFQSSTIKLRIVVPPSLSTVSLSTVSVTRSQLQSKNINWKVSEIMNKF